MERLTAIIATAEMTVIARNSMGVPDFFTLGDPKYGRGNSHPEGMRLVAVRLGFIDPWQDKAVAFSIAQETRLRRGWR